MILYRVDKAALVQESNHSHYQWQVGDIFIFFSTEKVGDYWFKTELLHHALGPMTIMHHNHTLFASGYQISELC